MSASNAPPSLIILLIVTPVVASKLTLSSSRRGPTFEEERTCVSAWLCTILTAFRAAWILFLLAKSDGDDAIFVRRGSILFFSSDLVSLSLGDAVAVVSFGVISVEGFLLKKGTFGAQPAETLNVKSKIKRQNNV